MYKIIDTSIEINSIKDICDSLSSRLIKKTLISYIVFTDVKKIKFILNYHDFRELIEISKEKSIDIYSLDISLVGFKLDSVFLSKKICKTVDCLDNYLNFETIMKINKLSMVQEFKFHDFIFLQKENFELSNIIEEFSSFLCFYLIGFYLDLVSLRSIKILGNYYNIRLSFKSGLSGSIKYIGEKFDILIDKKHLVLSVPVNNVSFFKPSNAFRVYTKICSMLLKEETKNES